MRAAEKASPAAACARDRASRSASSTTVTVPGARTVNAAGSRPAAAAQPRAAAISAASRSRGIQLGSQPSVSSAVMRTMPGCSVARKIGGDGCTGRAPITSARRTGKRGPRWSKRSFDQ